MMSSRLLLCQRGEHSDARRKGEPPGCALNGRRTNPESLSLAGKKDGTKSRPVIPAPRGGAAAGSPATVTFVGHAFALVVTVRAGAPDVGGRIHRIELRIGAYRIRRRV